MHAIFKFAPPPPAVNNDRFLTPKFCDSPIEKFSRDVQWAAIFFLHASREHGHCTAISPRGTFIKSIFHILVHVSHLTHLGRADSISNQVYVFGQIHLSIEAGVTTTTLIFSVRVDLDLGYAGIVGQDRRSKVKVKCQKLCFDFTITCCFKVKGQGQGQRSASRSMVKAKFLVRSG